MAFIEPSQFLDHENVAQVVESHAPEVLRALELRAGPSLPLP